MERQTGSALLLVALMMGWDQVFVKSFNVKHLGLKRILSEFDETTFGIQKN